MKRKIKSLRVKSNRDIGGQKGHDAHTLAMVKEPDDVIVHTVKQCQRCNRSLKDITADGYDSRQVADIPPLRLMVTEHRAEMKCYPDCGMDNYAAFPKEITNETQYR